MSSDRAIGIFDSGIGGLTVFRALERLLPAEPLIYLGDTARVPYGTKSEKTIQRYSRETINFLLQREVKLIVVACNTASALALPTIQKEFSVPIVGVVEPGARAAIAKTKNKRIGVIGTEGTIRSIAYPRIVEQLDPAVQVTSIACPLFVPFVEEGWLEGEAIHQVAIRYLAPFQEKKIDTLILGCTHYPLLKKVIQVLMGSIALVDSAEATAQAVQSILIQQKLVNLSG